MQIDLIHFTPWQSLVGGALIGLSAALFFALTGRIAGISGLFGGLLRRPSGVPFAFLLGIVLSSLLWRTRGWLPDFRLDPQTPGGWLLLIFAGLLVGYGARLANGCTSGHGVCGLARGSRRSLAAVLVFMSSGFSTVFLLRQLGGA